MISNPASTLTLCLPLPYTSVSEVMGFLFFAVIVICFSKRSMDFESLKYGLYSQRLISKIT